MTQETNEMTSSAQHSKKRALQIALGAFGAVLMFCFGAAVGDMADDGEKTTNTSSGGSSVVTVTTKPVPQQTTPSKPVEAPKPKPEDFKLSVKTLEKQCFGSAGCLITYRIEVAYSGPKLPDNMTYEVVYDVLGAENPITNRFTVTGDVYTVDESEMATTNSTKATLTAKATSVSQLS